jgi:hypothetical protein
MKLESLKISLRHEYRDAGPTNPYEAKLSVSFNDNSMQVALGDDVCRKILALAGDEIAKAAQVQISDFVKTAMQVSDQPVIQGALTDG